MFGFFKRKQEKELTKAHIDLVAELLTLQIRLGKSESDESDEQFDLSITDAYSRGYIWGCCDALLQKERIDGDSKLFSMLMSVHLQLFGVELGSVTFNKSLDSQDDPIFGEGRAKGGQELFEFLSDQAIPPKSLADHLRNGTTE